MRNSITLLAIIFIITMNSSNAQTKKELKKQEKIEKYKAMKALVENEKLSFEANAAFTQSGGRIDLIGNPNELVLNGVLSEADMPYFGVVQVSSLNSDNGINFRNESTNYDIEYDDKKQKITIKFSAKNKSENFNLTLIVSSDGFATLNITSSHRNLINYNGYVKALEDKKE